MIRPPAMLWLLLPLGCSNPNLGLRPCSAEGQCLSGFRCQDSVCIKTSEEVCDGQDNDGDRLVDKNLYGVAGEPIALPAISGEIEGPVFAWNGRNHLMAWINRDLTGGVFTVQYTIFNDEWRALSQTRTAAAVADALAVFSPAAAPAPGGFLIAYQEGRPPEMPIRVVKVSDDSVAEPPVLLGATGLVVDSPGAWGPALSVAWGPSGPVAAVVHDTSGVPTGIDVSTAPNGVYLLRPATEPRRMSSTGGSALATATRIVVDGAREVVSWAECIVDLPPPGTTLGCADSTLYLHHLGSAVTRTLSGADIYDLMWFGEQLFVGTSVRASEGDSIVLHRFDADLQPLPSPLVLREGLSSGVLASLIATPSEVAVVWGDVRVGGSTWRLSRVDPAQGPNGFPIDLKAMLAPVSAFHNGTAYGAILPTEIAGANHVVQRVACVGPQETPDGGADADGGKESGDGGPPQHDGGPPAGDGGTAPDGGSGSPTLPGPPCETDGDGGPVVSGTVLSMSGAPITTALVVGSCWTSTDDQGRFQAVASPPFDVTVVLQRSSSFVFSYLGVDSLAPTFHLPFEVSSTRVDLSLTYTPGLGRSGALHVFPETGGFSLERLNGTTHQEVNIWGSGNGTALFLERDEFGDFKAAQVWMDLAIAEGASVDLGTIAPMAIQSRLVAGTLPSTDFASVSLWLRKGRAEVLASQGELPPGSPFAIALPVLDGIVAVEPYLIAELSFQDDSEGWASSPILTTGTTEFRPELPAPPMLIAPTYNATGVGVAPRLELSAVTGVSAYGAVVFQVDGEQLARFHFATASSPTLQLPDLSPFGLALSPGQPARWSGWVVKGVAFADLLAGAPFVSTTWQGGPAISVRGSPYGLFTP